METEQKMLCAICKERGAVKKMTIAVSDGFGISLLLCEKCAEGTEEYEEAEK